MLGEPRIEGFGASLCNPSSKINFTPNFLLIKKL
jgi:hypothetical protein